MIVLLEYENSRRLFVPKMHSLGLNLLQSYLLSALNLIYICCASQNPHSGGLNVLFDLTIFGGEPTDAHLTQGLPTFVCLSHALNY